MPLAPVAAELALLAGILLLVALLYTYRITVAYMLESTLGRLPVVGGRAVAAIQGALDATADRFREWLAANLKTIVGWIKATADYSADLYDEIQGFGVDVAQSLDHAIHVTVHDIIKAFLVPVHLLQRALSAAVDSLEHDAERLRDRVFDIELPALRRELARLGNGIDRLRTDVIPALRRETFAGIDAIRSKLDDIALPRLGRAEVAIDGLRSGLRSTDDVLRGVREWVGPAALVFTGAAVLELLRHVRRCQDRTGRMCEYDLDAWDDFLGLAFLLPTLPAIVETMRESAKLLGEITDELDAAGTLPDPRKRD